MSKYCGTKGIWDGVEVEFTCPDDIGRETPYVSNKEEYLSPEDCAVLDEPGVVPTRLNEILADDEEDHDEDHEDHDENGLFKDPRSKADSYLYGNTCMHCLL